MSLLKTTGICKSFGGLAAISNVSMEVREQEILALIGPNGAGKTTLLNLITNFTTPDSGSIVLAGQDIAGLARHKIVKLGIARTFQSLTVFENLSVNDNITIGHSSQVESSLLDMLNIAAYLRVKKEHRHGLREKIAEVMAFVGLDPGMAKEPVHVLAMIDKKRVAIASALASGPTLLLLDEPLAGLNQSESQELLGLIRKAKSAGIAVLLIDHNLEAVMSIAERVLVLNFGELIKTGTPEEIIRSKRVSEVYLGK